MGKQRSKGMGDGLCCPRPMERESGLDAPESGTGWELGLGHSIKARQATEKQKWGEEQTNGETEVGAG